MLVVGRWCACPISVYTEVRDGCHRIDCRKHLRQTFSLKTLRQRIPIVGWLPKYRCVHLGVAQADVIGRKGASEINKFVTDRKKV